TLTLTNGVAVAVYGSKGTTLQNGAKLISGADSLHLNHLTRYNTVQEQATTNWTGSASSLMNITSSPSTLPQAKFQFTDISLMAGVASTRYILDGGLISNLSFTHCQLRGGFLSMFTGGNDSRQQTVGLTNNYCERIYFSFNQGYENDQTPFLVSLRNNLWRGGILQLSDYTHKTTWAVTDNLFESVSLSAGSTTFPNSNNGYSTNTTILPASSGGDKTITNFDYQASFLGDFYYPASGTNLATLINAGSRTASN